MLHLLTRYLVKLNDYYEPSAMEVYGLLKCQAYLGFIQQKNWEGLKQWCSAYNFKDLRDKRLLNISKVLFLYLLYNNPLSVNCTIKDHIYLLRLKNENDKTWCNPVITRP